MSVLLRTGRSGRVRGDILRRFRFDAGFAKEAEISEPVDEAVLPRAERRSIAGLQAIAVHAVPVDVHLDVE